MKLVYISGIMEKHCSRCNGLMEKDQIDDFYTVPGGWRCINCGARVDDVIIENQKDPPQYVPEEEPVPMRIGGRMVSHG